MRELTIQHHVAGMEFVGVDNQHDVAMVDTARVDSAAPCGRGGQCGSGQCRSGQMPVKMCSRQVEGHRLYVRSTHM